MKSNISNPSIYSDNSKLLQCWMNLETALRDTSTTATESQFSNFYTAQKNRPQTQISNLFKEFESYQTETNRNQKIIRPQTATLGASLSSDQFIKRPQSSVNQLQTTNQVRVRRPMTSIARSSRVTTSQGYVSNPVFETFQQGLTQAGSVKSLLAFKAKSRPHTSHGETNIHVPKDDLVQLNQLGQYELQQIIKNSEYIHTLKVDKIIDLYNAKCIDTKQKYQPDQAVKFIERIKKNCKKKNFFLPESQFGQNSAVIIKEIMLNNSNFSQIHLSKNFLGDIGIIEIAKALVHNRNIVHLDISSNNITPEGAHKFFNLLQKSSSIVSLDISSKDGLNRNKIGIYGCEPLETLLKKNNPLQILNLRGTGLGDSGFECILAGLSKNNSLVSLNVSQNDLNSDSCAMLMSYLETTSLQELDISNNNLQCTGIECLAKNLNRPAFKLISLDLTECKIKSLGIMKLFSSLLNNVHIEKLILDKNQLSGNGFNLIEGVLQSKCPLKYLSLNRCGISKVGAESLGAGLQKNTTLKKLFLKDNRVGDLLGEAVSKGIHLEQVDLRGCNIGDNGTKYIVNLIKQPTLQQILLSFNDIRDVGGAAIAESIENNPKIQVLDLRYNPMGYKHSSQIDKILQTHKETQTKNKIPEYVKEVEKLNEFNDQRFVLAGEYARLQQAEDAAKFEVSLVQKQKQKTREDETQQSDEIEQKFYQIIQELRELDRQGERTEEAIQNNINELDDEHSNLLKNITQDNNSIQQLEKDIRSIKDYHQQRKNLLEAKIEFMKRDLMEKTRTFHATEAGLQSFENQLNQLKTKIQDTEMKFYPLEREETKNPNEDQQEKPSIKQVTKKRKTINQKKQIKKNN